MAFSNEAIEYLLDVDLEHELYIYEIVLNELKLRIDHALYPYIYHGCEFVNEILYRSLHTGMSKFYIIPLSIMYIFLVYINRSDCTELDFCNFLCNTTNSSPIEYTMEIYPREIISMFKRQSRIVYTDFDCTPINVRVEIYKFLYNTSYNTDMLVDTDVRKIVYYMSKIFKHKSSVIYSHNDDKVKYYFKQCKKYIMENKEKFKFYKLLI